MECQICYEHFDTKNFLPKILVKCGHSFCRVCLERMINKKASIQCPVCRENTKIGKKETLPTNYSLCEVIDKTEDTSEVKNLLEKYKYFNDKDFRNVSHVINRNNEPKRLILKKIVNNDFIYVEEFELNQNYSFFNNLPKRNRRYNFNRNSSFAYIFNEHSYSISMYRKASKCKHSYSCLEYLLKNVFYSFCIGFFSKIPLQWVLKQIFKKFQIGETSQSGDLMDKYTLILQWAFGSFFSAKKIIKCLMAFYIDEILNLKKN